MYMGPFGCVCVWGGQLADLQASQMHNQEDQSVNVSLITTPAPLTPQTPQLPPLPIGANYTLSCPPPCSYPVPSIKIPSKDNNVLTAEELPTLGFSS